MGDVPLFAKFPSYLGKMSATRKTSRLLKEAAHALGESISGSREALRRDYVPMLFKHIRDTLKNSVEQALTIMEHYKISPDFLREVLAELQYNPKGIDLMAVIPKNSKANLTRLYNQSHRTSLKKTKGKRQGSPEDSGEEEEEEREEAEMKVEAGLKSKGKKGRK